MPRFDCRNSSHEYNTEVLGDENTMLRVNGIVHMLEVRVRTDFESLNRVKKGAEVSGWREIE